MRPDEILLLDMLLAAQEAVGSAVGCLMPRATMDGLAYGHEVTR